MIQTTLIESIGPMSFARFIDRTALFMQQWGFRKGGVSNEEWSRRVAVELEPMLSSRLRNGLARRLWNPSAVFAIVPAWSDRDSMILADGDPENATPDRAVATFGFIRDANGNCLADALPPVGSSPVLTGWLAVTLGDGIADQEAVLKDAGEFEEYHLLHGLSVVLAEALAEEIHRRIRADMGLAADDSPDPAKIVRGGYRGRRFSFGYPCCPDLGAQKALLEMLGASRIGISLNESMQMEPELSVTAGVISQVARFSGS